MAREVAVHAAVDVRPDGEAGAVRAQRDVLDTTEGSSTNTGQAFKSCQELLAPSVVIGPDSQKVIIMLTDGNPSALGAMALCSHTLG